VSDSSVEHDPGICGLDPAHLSHLNNSAKVPLNFDCELFLCVPGALSVCGHRL
jgi:hypothetical protein